MEKGKKGAKYGAFVSRILSECKIRIRQTRCHKEDKWLGDTMIKSFFTRKISIKKLEANNKLPLIVIPNLKYEDNGYYYDTLKERNFGETSHLKITLFIFCLHSSLKATSLITFALSITVIHL